MLDVLNGKILEQKLTGVRTVFAASDDAVLPDSGYQLIVSSMTFHHVGDVRALVRRLFFATAAGGTLCVADLDSDGGRFHQDSAGVFHNGFSRDEMEKYFTEAGFSDVTAETAAEVLRDDGKGGEASFTIFPTKGTRPI